MAEATVSLELTREEMEVLRTALQLLKDMLSREEADELDLVHAIQAKLPLKSEPRG